MKQDMKEREERWITEIRKTLRRAEEPLPEGGWDALERDLAAAGRRRNAFGSGWKKIAAVAAVVAIAVLIGETVVNHGVVDGDRKTEFFAGELTTADGQFLPNDEVLPTHSATSPEMEISASLAARVRYAVAEQSSGTAAGGNLPVQPVASGAAEADRIVAAGRDFAEPGPVSESATATEPSTEAAERSPAANSSRRTITRTLPDDPASRTFTPKRLPRRTSVGLFAAGLPTAQHVSSGRATPIRGSHVLSSSGFIRMKRGYDDYLYKHKQPLSFGFSVRKEFSYGLSLESGLVYSLLRSDVRVSEEDESFSQTLHMLGIPLRVNWDFLARSNWKLYLGAGGLVEKNLYAKFGSESVAEKTLQWSLTANAGVQYDFTHRTALYFEPGVSYYLTETDLRTARTASPVNLSLQLGVRLTY